MRGLVNRAFFSVTTKKTTFQLYQIPLPAVLKLEFGSSAVGVKHVHSLQEAVQHVKHVQDTLRSEQDHPGVGLGHGCSLILMPRLLGSEHDVDVVLFEGQLMAAFVSDNGPTRLPLCSETAATLPSVLHKGESTEFTKVRTQSSCFTKVSSQRPCSTKMRTQSSQRCVHKVRASQR